MSRISKDVFEKIIEFGERVEQQPTVQYLRKKGYKVRTGVLGGGTDPSPEPAGAPAGAVSRKP